MVLVCILWVVVRVCVCVIEMPENKRKCRVQRCCYSREAQELCRNLPLAKVHQMVDRGTFIVHGSIVTSY